MVDFIICPQFFIFFSPGSQSTTDVVEGETYCILAILNDSWKGLRNVGKGFATVVFSLKGPVGLLMERLTGSQILGLCFWSCRRMAAGCSGCLRLLEVHLCIVLALSSDSPMPTIMQWWWLWSTCGGRGVANAVLLRL